MKTLSAFLRDGKVISGPCWRLSLHAIRRGMTQAAPVLIKPVPDWKQLDRERSLAVACVHQFLLS